jgi:hypothetical protein
MAGVAPGEVLFISASVGGSARSAEPTLPGIAYSLDPAILPLGYASPFRYGPGDDAASARLLWLRLPQDRTISQNAAKAR